MSVAHPPFQIAGQDIVAGNRVTLSISVPGQSVYTPLAMPVHVVHGKRPGPVLFVSAAIHGDEINGIEVIRQLLKVRALSRLRGTLICVPIVNVYGFLNHTRYLPDRRDLNRVFPGAKHGSLASRMARVFAEEIIDRSTHGIDLHTGANNRTNLPHIRANLDDRDCESLALIFGTPVVINANLRDGSLRQYALERGIPMLLYEAGEALRFQRMAVRAGLRGILNVMRALEMLPKRKTIGPKVPVVEARSSSWIRAPQTGLLRTDVRLGNRIKEEETLGHIADALGENEAVVKAPFTGIVIGRNQLPVVNEGDALFHIARFSDSLSVEDAIETFHETHIEGLESGDYHEPLT
ncbi:MAG: succinylglutamate desuccinylase/aspartoacylase family protein [Hyphomicrobiales bacterium]|nr:succinylglutamate desuccinylase/aspartoacylase family protein [Hyphomicrobiales bacterium]